MTTIRSVRVFSAAKVNALLYGVLGLLVAPFLLLGPGMAMVGGSRPAGFGGVVLFAIFLPLFYAICGFIAGAVFAFLYNAIARAIGGIEVELAGAVIAPAIIPTNAIAITAPAEVLPSFPESTPPKPPEFE